MSRMLRNGARALAMMTGMLILAIIAPRYLWFARRRLPAFHGHTLPNGEGGDLAVAHIERGHDRLIVVSHGLLKTMRSPKIVRSVNQVLERFDVLLYDQAGHGNSTGLAGLDLERAAGHLHRVIAYALSLGYRRLGLVGFSLGAGAGILAVSEGEPIDALVSISSPVAPQWFSRTRFWTRPVGWWLRLMGTRVRDVVNLKGRTVDAVATLPGCPILIVHCGLDTLIPKAASEVLYAEATEPKEWLCDCVALHAAPKRSYGRIIDWLDSQMV